ncbi:Thymidylate kinase [Comamonas sp. PE63]|uniref:Thymidylate kinase n=1 Tax=Comamonas brasiliensis TaxID=1812482 RepID=A0ABS5LML7_9BURK|nr:Thymidylate kinase [Comamonas sp. PE63]
MACALCRIKQLVPPCAALEEISVSTALPKGLFISFEGIDGAGKSSHIEALAQAFRDQGRVVTLTREPGGTPLAEKLRALMLHDAMDPLTEALIAFAARRDHLVQVIEPALARGEVVISDRFTDATFAYQGAGRGFSWEQLSVLERMAQTGTALQAGPAPDFMREPDMTLWFDLPAEVAAERLATARVPDRFEAQPGEFFARVAQGYAERARTAPQRFVRIDAHASRHAVWQQITQAVVRKGWLAIMVGSKP